MGRRENMRSQNSKRRCLVASRGEVFGVDVAVEIQGTWAQVGTRGACRVEPQLSWTGMLRALSFITAHMVAMLVTAFSVAAPYSVNLFSDAVQFATETRGAGNSWLE
jgi:hypothetical protein